MLRLVVLIPLVFAIEQGKLEIKLEKDHIARIPKSLYKDAAVKLYMQLDCKDKEQEKVKVKFVMRSTTCLSEFTNMQPTTINCTNVVCYEVPGSFEWYYSHPEMKFDNAGSGMYYQYEEDVKCNVNHFSIPTEGGPKWAEITETAANKEAEVKSELAKEENVEKAVESGQRKRRFSQKGESQPEVNLVTKVPLDAQYLLMIGVIFQDEASVANLQIEFEGPLGYLSAFEYPLLTFFKSMTIGYCFLGLFWLIFSFLNYKELLRIQFWIGGVIFLGMLEKAVFYSEYNSVNNSGISLPGAHKFAEAVSALKRSLARMLVIIVSLGFGVIKPRLGPMLHRIVGVGALYFILATVDAFVHVDTALHEHDNTAILFTQIPLAILDSIICWWIFVSLLSTMKTLRLRRNVMKLALYRHFANIVGFMVVASVIFILWDIQTHRMGGCHNAWDELWLNKAFWHLLFSVILLSIMVLWRPSANSQRYAYSPLVDDVDSEDEEDAEVTTKSSVAMTVKKRGGDGGGQVVDKDDKMEDDLKWIDENIPETLAEGSAALMDSDDEVMNTKYEMSKME